LIYPTRLAVLIAGAGVPVTLLVSATRSDDWFVGLAWPVAVLLLFVVDAVLAARGGTVEVALPPSAFVGETRDALVSTRFAARPPARAEIALGTNALLSLDDDGLADLDADRVC
jgi:hypothetical protein